MAFQYVDYPQKMKDLLMQIFDDSFMQANTRFQSFEGFRYSSAVFVNWNSDCLIYDDALLKGSMPYLAVMIVITLLFIFIPGLSTFIPNAMFT